MFCPKCKSILVPQKEGRSTKLACSCGYVSNKKEDLVIKEKTRLQKDDVIVVVDKKMDVLPTTKESCNKCGHGEAYYWTVQTRAGDEAETRFFKCVKCSHTWRKY